MNIKTPHIEVSGIPVEIVRKDIKNLHLGVYPPNGRVRVASPLRLSDDAVRMAVATRIGWVRRQQNRFYTQDRQSRREMISGETHYVNGRRYRLRVVEAPGPASVHIRNNCWLELRVHPGTNSRRRQAVLNEWHRERLRSRVSKLLQRWCPRLGVKTPEFGIKQMRTRWGSCNAKSGRIWVNLELARRTAACVEYVVVHELIHLIERHHNAHFRSCIDQVMPGWRSRRDELNRFPLAHEDWDY